MRISFYQRDQTRWRERIQTEKRLATQRESQPISKLTPAPPPPLHVPTLPLRNLSNAQTKLQPLSLSSRETTKLQPVSNLTRIWPTQLGIDPPPRPPQITYSYRAIKYPYQFEPGYVTHTTPSTSRAIPIPPASSRGDSSRFPHSARSETFARKGCQMTTFAETMKRNPFPLDDDR